ncbi:MAG: hypothetical protein KBS59_08285, partial [Clostridiales bacterium]|nr:hypothetical protein [Clostridiales bacterium]
KISGAKICGPVSKLIEVDPKYATALEVAFGAMLQNKIAEDEESAKNVIAYLKNKNAGRVTLYPISTMRGRELDAKAENIALCRGYVSVASALVKTDTKYAEIIKSLIGRVIVCDNIDNAADMARASGHKYKIVTLDGQVINAGGSFTGGSVSADGGMLSRRSQIEKLNAEIAELEKQSAEAEQEEAALANEAETIRKEEGVILGSASVLKTLRDAEATQIEVIKSNIAVVKEAMDKLCDEKTLMLARVSKETDSIEELTKKENDCREKQVDLAQRIKELEDEKSSYGDGLDEIRARRAELEIELAKKDQFVSLKSEQAAGARARLEAQRENMERGRAESEELADKIKLNEQKIEEYQKAMKDAEKLCLELAAKKDEIIAESDRLEKKLVEIRNTQSDTAHRRELAFEEYTRLDSSHGQLTEKHDALINFLWETYELTYTAASALGYEKMTKEARSEAASKQQKYKNVMRQLGNVNVGSIDEYSDVKGRYE